MNSTTILNALEAIAEQQGTNEDINIVSLASEMHITLPVLVSLLTELEQRDEITMQISTLLDGDLVSYTGTVKVMDAPPDEQRPNDQDA